ncbi:MAG: pantetheine-phosphate adenylyltransferase [Actinomycetota bacterium]|nr:pantetheine-phosphate adenylyltransferase [Actinomycetota bacterium]
MSTACCPGSFDPVTLGHLDVVTRAASLFDRVSVAVLVNEHKRNLFDLEERLAMLREVTADLPRVSVEAFDGLLVDFCAERGIGAIVKGLRSGSDLDYELPMARMNVGLGRVETVFVPPAAAWSHVSSSLVKEVAALGGDVSGMLPPPVHAALVRRLAERRGGA